MKYKILVFAVCFMISFFSVELMAQTGSGFGIKAGPNYNSNGKYFKEANVIFGDPMQNLGFHAGFFGKLNLGPVFIRPELMYSQMNTNLDRSNYLTQRIDNPILGGINLLGSLITIFAGPSFHYTLNDDFINFKGNPESKRFNSGYQVGAGLNLGRLGLDLRYEREFRGQSVNIDKVLSGGELKYQQILLGLSIRL